MQTATPAARKAPRPRADALRNRERIVTAAREMFVEHGPDVPTARISEVTEARAATRRGRIRRFGCMHGPFQSMAARRTARCTLSITLGRRMRARALKETERGSPAWSAAL